jgi:hypothetical protein
MATKNQKLPPHYALLPGAGKSDIFLPHKPGIIFEEMARFFKDFKISLSFYVGEPFWQAEAIYHDTCRAVKIPDCIGSIYNLPLNSKLVKELNIEAIITTGKIFDAWASCLDVELLRSVKYWYLMGTARPAVFEKIRNLSPKAKIFQHYAPFAVVAAGYQCEHLAGNPNLFHPSKNPKIKLELSPKNKILVTIGKPLLLKALKKYPTKNFGKIYEKRCPCGQKRIFEIAV